MKKILNIWLFAALISGLSLSVTSCKDDDDDNGGNNNGTEQETGATETDEAMAAYNWLANMTNIDDFTDDWASKTYEPTIGVESKNEANTRIVVVADIDFAKMNFASISGMAIDQLSTAQSQTIDGVGTITWTPSAAGASNLATVDVSTKLIPHLTKIVYCTEDQVGDNGNGFDGTAYFRFGDVISDLDGYFWVCVKPAFGTGTAPQQQGYWINVINRDPKNGVWEGSGEVAPLPTKNIKDKWNKTKDNNNNTILLPTELKSTKEEVHNLGNLVWALLDPKAYQEAAENKGIGLGGYDYKYNGRIFCQRVAQKWSERHIWEKLFNRTYAQMKQMKKLNFFYNGYHWLRGSTAGVWIGSSTGYQTVFTKSMDADDTLFEMQEKGAGFDIRRYCSDPKQDAECAKAGKAGYAPAKQFTDTEGYWVVRGKTSSDIAGTFFHPSVYVNLKNSAEIYRYNSAYHKMEGSEAPVEVDEEGNANRGFYSIGDVVTDKNKSLWFCVQPSTYGSEHSSAETDYAYFVSFDKDAIGKKLQYIPESRELAAQILFNLGSWFIEGVKTINNSNDNFQKMVNNVKNETGVDWYNLFILRDTTCQTNNSKQNVRCGFGSTLYFLNDSTTCVLRLILDKTKKQQGDGSQDYEWSFWDSYTADPKQIMDYSDLAIQAKIDQYAEDEWVYRPWFNPVAGEVYADARLGKRKKPDIFTDVSHVYYSSVAHNPYSSTNLTAVTNMYYEPLIPFAVKRVKDEGYASNYFEDNTEYTHVSLAKDYISGDFVLLDDQMDSFGLKHILQYYKFKSSGITLNGKPFDFKINNKP